MSELPKVLITNTVSPEEIKPLEGLAELIMGPSDGNLMPRDKVLALAPDLTGIINQAELKVDQELLDQAPKLKIVANVALGYDNLDVETMARRGVWATNVTDCFYLDTAEFTMGLLISLTRRIAEADRFVRAGKWNQFQPGIWDGMELRGKTLGIVGYGRIGKALARRARAFDMNILLHRRTTVNSPEYSSLDKLLNEADIVTVHTPINEDSLQLFNRHRFNQMKRGAFFINVARGPVVVETDLVEALQSCHLAGAALDVFEQEPTVHPALLTMDNVILTPHIAGGGTQSRFRARRLCAENIASVLQDKPPLTPVKTLHNWRGAFSSS